MFCNHTPPLWVKKCNSEVSLYSICICSLFQINKNESFLESFEVTLAVRWWIPGTLRRLWENRVQPELSPQLARPWTWQQMASLSESGVSCSHERRSAADAPPKLAEGTTRWRLTLPRQLSASALGRGYFCALIKDRVYPEERCLHPGRKRPFFLFNFMAHCPIATHYCVSYVEFFNLWHRCWFEYFEFFKVFQNTQFGWESV